MSDKGLNYDRVAAYYESASGIFSAGQIKAAKLAQLKWITTGSSILYLGCGSGEDVIASAKAGHKVAAIDLSQKMIDRLRKKLEKENLRAELICGDVFELDRQGSFDVVAANFFFNVFTGELLERIVDKAMSLVKEDGMLLIGEVSLPQGSIPSRIFNWCYINYAQFMAWVCGLVELHKNHNYDAIFNNRDWMITDREHFRFLRYGPILFQTLKIQKTAASTQPQPLPLSEQDTILS